MDPIETTVSFFLDIEARDWKRVGDLMSEDFTFSGFLPDPSDKETWLAYQEALSAAFPDWKFHLSDVHIEGSKTSVTVQITGTHKAELKLPLDGFKPVAATGTRVKLPQERATLTFNEAGQLHSLKVEPIAHGNLPGLLEQLGLE